jgi:ATP-dependent RNA helicase DDX31/DBP7
MADDGMLMNFDLGDSPLTTKASFKGGRWKDRLTAKKVAKHRQTKAQGGSRPPPPTREIFNEKSHSNPNFEYIGPGPGTATRPPKRQRLDPEKPVEGRNAATASIISGKLPPGSIDFTGRNSIKKTFDSEDVPAARSVVSGRNAQTASVISGKLPPGSIDFSGKNSTKKTFTFDDDEPPKRAEVVGRNPQTASVISGKLPPGSISTGPKRDASGKPLSVISSLFSFNPSSKTKFDEPTEELEPAKPSNAPLSDEFSTFTNLGMSRRLATHLGTKLEMKAPTGIQKAAIPQLIADDSDAFIQAETGSGKTLAYLLPIVERIMAISARDDVDGEAGAAQKEGQIHRNSGLFAIVMAPTRELCKQISTVLDRLLRCAPWIVGTTVIGGESKKSEKARLRKGVNILIATPGRLADHLDNTEVLNVSTVRWLVLDEGDRLMELGFEEEIKGIVEKIGRRALAPPPTNSITKVGLPKRRVTVLCSATMKMDVQKLGEISLKDAVHIQADPTEEEAARKKTEGADGTDVGFSAPAQLKQAYGVVPAKLRLVTLTAVLKRAFARRGSVMKAIVFISCADSVDFHFSLFSRPAPIPEEGTEAPPAPVISKSELTKDTVALGAAFSNPDNSNPVILHKLHGSLAQNIRTATLKSFADSKDPCVLICTDVASRGLDLPNVDYVIEYDPPFSAEDHLHRVGRTARAGAAGRALIFLLPGDEESYIPILASSYHNNIKALQAHTAEDLVRKGFGGTGHEWEDRATEWQLEVERWTLDSPKYLEMARRGYQSHIRAYATHVAAERSIFNMQTLHLGHLAKAFGLRDKPGSIRVPGLRPTKMTKADRSVAERKKARAEKDKAAGKVSKEEENRAPEGERVRKARLRERDMGVTVDKDDAAKRMKRKMAEHMASAAEFNIG